MPPLRDADAGHGGLQLFERGPHGVEPDGRLVHDQVHVRRLYARHVRQRGLDPPDASGAVHPFDRQTDSPRSRDARLARRRRCGLCGKSGLCGRNRRRSDDRQWQLERLAGDRRTIIIGHAITGRFDGLGQSRPIGARGIEFDDRRMLAQKHFRRGDAGHAAQRPIDMIRTIATCHSFDRQRHA
jgi:hypothetical protein